MKLKIENKYYNKKTYKLIMADQDLINQYLKNIYDGNIDKVKEKGDIFINSVGRLNPKGYNLIPIFACLALVLEKPNIGREMLTYLLSHSTINVSQIVIQNNGEGWTNEIFTTYHIMSNEKINHDVCEQILNHDSFDVNVLNKIDHDDYTPLDLADEYNKEIIKLLESRNAIRNFRVGPGFKLDRDNYPS